MKSFSVYLLVVISGLLFISSTPTLSLSEVKIRVKKISKSNTLEKRSIEEKVKADLRAERSLKIRTIGVKPPQNSSTSVFSDPNSSVVSNNVEIMPEKNKVVVKEYRQATLSEAAQTFNRKCLELEALLKER